MGGKYSLKTLAGSPVNSTTRMTCFDEIRPRIFHWETRPVETPRRCANAVCVTPSTRQAKSTGFLVILVSVDMIDATILAFLAIVDNKG